VFEFSHVISSMSANCVTYSVYLKRAQQANVLKGNKTKQKHTGTCRPANDRSS